MIAQLLFIGGAVHISIMLKYIVLCLSICLCVQCDSNKEEGASCEWEGIKGKCVNAKRCLSSLDDRSPKQPACEGGKDLICCTDCELVDDTDNAVIMPTGGFFMKDGSKARDSCLQYIKDQPYKCHDTAYGGVMRGLNAEKQCHVANFYAIGGAPPLPIQERAEYPHQALLGYGDSQETAKWQAGGSIISDKYILTAAHALTNRESKLNFVAVGVMSFSDQSKWQVLKVKRVVAHPDYQAPTIYNDIGLIETETLIKFNNNVLPACLHVEDDLNISEAVATTWKDLESTDKNTFADTLQTIMDVEQYSDKDCSELIQLNRRLKNGYNKETQMCYASKKHPTHSCKGLSGEPLLVQNQFSYCAYTVIGITSHGYGHCGADSLKPDLYTRVLHFVPWIESVVWP